MATDVPAIVAFRVDSGADMGVGHLVRCLTLAGELVRKGARVQFLCRELPGHISARAEKQGYPLTLLSAPRAASGSHWLQVPAAQDAAETRAVLERLRPDWLVVDHYGIDVAWEQAQRSAVGRIFVIDDNADRHHDCVALLDQNFFGPTTTQRYDGLVPDGCRLLLGPRYALLRPEYARLRASRPRRIGAARRVLVYFGGTDASDETSKALRALSASHLAHLAVDVVLGPNHPRLAAVEALAATRPGTAVHRELPSLADLMLNADLVVGAGGTTTWERMCLGLPSVVITVVPNQEAPTAALADAGLVFLAGRAAEVSAEYLASVVSRALETPRLERSLVDGYGLARVAAALMPPSLKDLRLRAVTAADSELLFEWRNEAHVRAMSFDTQPIEWDVHQRWLRAKLASRDTQIFVGEVDGLPVGQARLEYGDNAAALSYSVDAIVRGRGFGAALVERAIGSAERVPPAGFRAHVKTENVASRRIFERLGWRESSDQDGLVFCLSANPARCEESSGTRRQARRGEER